MTVKQWHKIDGTDCHIGQCPNFERTRPELKAVMT